MIQNIPKPSIKLVRGKTVENIVYLNKDGEYLIGRAPKCPIRVIDPSVSRQHARLFVEGTTVWIEDLGSVNGTFVNGKRIEEKVQLKDGDVVQVGQRSVRFPLLLVFDDPAGRLLQELGLEDEKEEQPERESDREPQQEIPEPVPPQQEEVKKVDTDHHEEQEEPEEPEETHPIAFEKKWVVLPGAGVLLIILFSLFFLFPHLKKEKLVLSAFKLSPSEVYPGSMLSAYSPDIVPGRKYIVKIGDKSLEVTANEQRRLLFSAPEIEKEKYFNRAITLRILNEDHITLAEGSVVYRVRPEIQSIEPNEVHVGEKLTIRGKYLKSRAGIRVFFGDKEGNILKNEPQAIVVRVPVVTRNEPVELPLTFQFGTLKLEHVKKVRVLPKVLNPLDLELAPYYHEQTQVWFIQTRFGPLLPVPVRTRASDEPPPEVVRVNEALGKVFLLAETSNTVRFGIRKSRNRYTLIAEDPENQFRLVIVRWPLRFLEDVVTLHAVSTSAEIFPYWIVRVLHTYLDVFQRGKEPSQPTLPVETVLQKLVRHNYERGGLGRPELEDLVVLKENEKSELNRFLFQVDPSFGRVEGIWKGSLSNVFFANQPYTITVSLSLNQKGLNISGVISIRFEKGQMKIDIPTKRITGQLLFEDEMKIRLSSRMQKPVGKIVFHGVVRGDEMEGSCGVRNGKECTFKFKRIPSPQQDAGL